MRSWAQARQVTVSIKYVQFKTKPLSFQISQQTQMTSDGLPIAGERRKRKTLKHAITISQCFPNGTYLSLS